MRILIITPRIPYPPHRGDNLHAYNISKQLSKNNSVHIATQISNSKQFEFLNALESEGLKTFVVKLPLLKSVINLFFALLKSTPFQVAYFSNRKFEKLIKDLISKNEYDLIYFHLIRSVQYFSATKNSKALKVADLTDAVSLYLSRYINFLKNPIRKIFFSIEQKRVFEYEKSANVFDTIFLCSEVDRDYLKQHLPNANLQLLRNGVNESFFEKTDVKIEKHRIMFSGNMPYYPNCDAAIYFAKKIFPEITKLYNDSKFYIVGQKPSRQIKNLSSDKIIVTGFVKDIKTEYLKSEVNIAPIRFGAGTPNKVLESLALGVPVVATIVAIAGLPNELKKFVFVANDEKEFVEKVRYIFENREKVKAQMKECEILLPKILGWENIISDFENYIQKRLNK